MSTGSVRHTVVPLGLAVLLLEELQQNSLYQITTLIRFVYIITVFIIVIVHCCCCCCCHSTHISLQPLAADNSWNIWQKCIYPDLTGLFVCAFHQRVFWSASTNVQQHSASQNGPSTAGKVREIITETRWLSWLFAGRRSGSVRA